MNLATGPAPAKSAAAPRRAGSLVPSWGWACLWAIALTALFWLPLWKGGGFVGGDTYAYHLPQKQFYAERLRAGELPLWNNRVGWGYPQLAESQTGALYPINLALYGLLDLNTAFSASLILHYALAFGFTWLYARQLGIPPVGALLAGLVYVYGWFPPRVCLEWAIIGGAWLPLALWSAERLIATRHWRYAIWLTVVLGAQMLAGHFLLAFITQLVVAASVPLRLWWARGGDEPGPNPVQRIGVAGGTALALAGGFLLAAAQLVPTWELKSLSQRETVTTEHDPRYGYVPVPYLTQIVAPWHWYLSDDAFGKVLREGWPRTNRVEAHLYFGLVPLALAVWGLARCPWDRRLTVWLVLGGAALVYTTGYLAPLTSHLPGFSYFEGPGRFGVVTTLAAALWAGWALPQLVRKTVPEARGLLVVLVFAGTAADLWLVSREVTDAVLVAEPPIKRLELSPLRARFAEEGAPVRLFSDGKNLPSALGVSTLPVYLGLGPAQYFDPNLMIPGASKLWGLPIPEQVEWMQRSGVTHLLSFRPLDKVVWPVQSVAWHGSDTFLNPALGRTREEPLFLSKMTGTRGRIAWADPDTGEAPRLIEYEPQRVVVETDAKRPGRLILTDLQYPGWELSVDGRPATSLTEERLYRAVALEPGPHTVVWTYRPASVYWGLGISGLTSILLLALGHLRFWRPYWWARLSQSVRKT